MSDAARLGSLFFTGTSPFLVANGNFVQALVAASSHCSIQASEDIFDATGMKLWAGGNPIDSRLLERLSDRKLRKPIELCVYAADPVAAAAIGKTIEARVAASEDLAAVVDTNLGAVLQVVKSFVPNPSELMLYSVLRHGSRELMEHAALVTALALAAAMRAGVHPDLLTPLARAALLHDVGELYLPAELFDGPGPQALDRVRDYRTHADLGARVAFELAHCPRTVGQLIAMSHERLDGWGYPGGLHALDLPLPGQALLFAEGMVPLLESGINGLHCAAVAARLIPDAFPNDMVSWIGNCAQARPLPQVDLADAQSVGLELRQVASLLARILVLLKVPMGETSAVQAASAPWLAAIEALIKVLNKAGIEEAISCGIDVSPQGAREMLEMSALTESLLDRIRLLRTRIEQSVADTAELGASALVVELLAALQGCEPNPIHLVRDGKSSMTVLPWSNLFCVGVREIDDQHRVLVDLLNRLGAAVDGNSTEIQGEILESLTQYVGRHFADEERLMIENGYEQAAAHLADHRRLTERVGQMSADFKQGKAPSMEALAIFLRQWLTFHILHTDKELGIALNARGVH